MYYFVLDLTYPSKHKKLELKNHQVWQDIREILDKIDVNALVAEHLEACDYKICGYWDENDQFYEEIILPRFFLSKLVSSFIGISIDIYILQLR